MATEEPSNGHSQDLPLDALLAAPEPPADAEEPVIVTAGDLRALGFWVDLELPDEAVSWLADVFTTDERKVVQVDHGRHILMPIARSARWNRDP